ncbi:DUF418 domain-containing protein [Pseudoblastomonas halimionae]|uniref:DUF418 domain-containing protein n=1 Tax=Alteriqipengyuania halimionae TaxID=1926630 RepID=A0A6I4U1B6_9SPHN|nr:DUF418 domain-containing protein [Alteriqipengyuania halimionae]MXP08735.1 DUF418 domain-containing protein [Alteriqipengyuania halimionae]
MAETTAAAAAAVDQPRTEIAPIAQSGERIVTLDWVRGIAVLGILAANIVAFGQPMTAYMYPDAFTVPHSDAEDWMWVAQFVAIDGKMRGLFTLLFGAGLYLFMEKAWAAGNTRWLQARRLVWLMLFGLAHFFLIWRGDILFSYAVCGLVALLCLRWTAKTQLIVGLAGTVLGFLAYLAMLGFAPFVVDGPLGEQEAMQDLRTAMVEQQEAQLEDGREQTRIITEQSYGDFVAFNIDHTGELGFMFIVWLFETLPLMLVGIALYRMGMWTGGMRRDRLLLWGWLGLLGGGALSLLVGLWALDNGLTYYGTQSAFVAFCAMPRFVMTLGLAALLAAYGPGATGWLSQRLSAAGRAAFTNYLGTSIVMLFVFHGWAGGLFGELGRTELYGVVLAMWVLMLAWSKPWLARFRYGPFEWLWRCLTYGRIFPLRR